MCIYVFALFSVVYKGYKRTWPVGDTVWSAKATEEARVADATARAKVLGLLNI